MRVSMMVVLLTMPVVALAAPKKVGKPTVVVDGPPAMVKVVNAALAARFTPVVAKRSISATPTAKEVRDVTGPVNAIAVVLVQPTPGFLSLVVLNGADGTPLEKLNVRLTKKPLKALPKDVWASLVGAVATGAAPSAAKVRAEQSADVPVVAEGPTRVEPTPVARAEPTPTPEAAAEAPSGVTKRLDEPATVSALPAIRAGVGFRGFSRSLGWGKGSSNVLATYALPFAPSVAVDAQWFPGAHVTGGLAANFGVAFQGDFSVGVISRIDDSRFGTQATRLRASAMYRHPILDSHGELDVQLGYAAQSFTIAATAANDGSARPNVPSVAFTGPRAAAGVRFRFGVIELDALAGFQLAVGKGELASTNYFPKASAFALDGGLGVSARILPNISLRLGGDVSRCFVSLNAADAALVGTTASDTSFGGSFSVAWVM